MKSETTPSWRTTSRVHRIAVFGLLGCMGISAPLWYTRTDFPFVPLLSAYSEFSALFSPWTVIVLGLALIVSFAERWRSVGLVVAILALILLVCEDLMRFQPWVYHFATLFLILAVFGHPSGSSSQTDSPQHPEPSSHHDVWWLSCWTLIFIYLWSGWHKFHPLASNSAPMLFMSSLPSPWLSWLLERWGTEIRFGFAWVEMVLGISLLSIYTRRWGVILLTIMHVLILITLISLQHDANVYPWNLACVACLWLLFWPFLHQPLWRLPYFLRDGRFFSVRFVCGGLILLLYGVCPLLHTWNAWDANLSFALYTGNYGYRQLLISERIKQRLTPKIQAFARPVTQNLPTSPPSSPKPNPAPPTDRMPRIYELDFYAWSLQRFQTTVPPSLLFYRAALTRLCEQFPHEHILLVTRRKWIWLHHKGKIHLQTCYLSWHRPNWPTEPQHHPTSTER